MNRIIRTVVVILAPICCCLGQLSDSMTGPRHLAPETDQILIRSLASFTPTSTSTPPGGNLPQASASSGPQAAGPVPTDAVTPIPLPPTPAGRPGPTAPPARPPTGVVTAVPPASPAVPTILLPQPTPSRPAPDEEDDTARPLPDDDDDTDRASPPAAVTMTRPPRPPAAPLPVAGFSAQNYRVNEADGAAIITVTLSTPAGQPVALDYATTDGTAGAGRDYTAASQTLDFAPGQTSQTFSVLITNDTVFGERPGEVINLNLSRPTGAVSGLMTATLTIIDDDTFVVNSIDDQDDNRCTAGHCSLREAIGAANTKSGPDAIFFDIPGSGPHSIQPAAGLPDITGPVFLDGLTQPGARCDSRPPILLIELDGSQTAGTERSGLRITAGHSTVRGLVINRFGGPGLALTTTGHNRILCNYIGVDVSGAQAMGNGGEGIEIQAGSAGNRIGGPTLAEGNIIAGNKRSGIHLTQPGTTGNLVQGNFIGTDRTGTIDLGNYKRGMHQEMNASNNTIDRNLIAYNKEGGLKNETGYATVRNSLIFSNTTSTEGGGLFNSGGLAITATIISSNTAASGGGLFNTGRLTLTRSTIRGNAANQAGGGLYNIGKMLTLDNSTLSSNTGGAGGTGLFNGNNSVMTASQSTIYNNVSVKARFKAKSHGSAGNFPRSVAVGDFDQDGRLDMTLVFSYSNRVMVLLGTGDGDFKQAAAGFSVGRKPLFATGGDFNEDGRLDLATANRLSNNVTVLLGVDQGRFAEPAAHFDAGDRPVAVTVGDFNGDDHLDLATANRDSNNVSILLGDGQGRFEPPAHFGVGKWPRSVTVGDFNGDGRPDLAAANHVSNTVSLLIGDGQGRFAEPAAHFAVGRAPEVVIAEDFDGDGWSELVTANHLSNDVSLLWGDGQGRFDDASPLTLEVGRGPKDVEGGDFNGDGHPDLVVTNHHTDNVAVLLGDGKGGFEPPTFFAVEHNPEEVVVADFNGDGRPDLAVTNRSSHSVSILLNTSGTTIGQDSGTLTLQNSILAAPAGALCSPESDVIISGGYNLTGDSRCRPFSTAVTDITNVNPLLAPLQKNGDLIETHPLRPGSAAIDHIPIGVNGCGTTIVADQRGVSRPLDGDGDLVEACDVGAYEYQAH